MPCLYRIPSNTIYNFVRSHTHSHILSRKHNLSTHLWSTHTRRHTRHTDPGPDARRHWSQARTSRTRDTASPLSLRCSAYYGAYYTVYIHTPHAHAHTSTHVPHRRTPHAHEFFTVLRRGRLHRVHLPLHEIKEYWCSSDVLCTPEIDSATDRASLSRRGHPVCCRKPFALLTLVAAWYERRHHATPFDAA